MSFREVENLNLMPLKGPADKTRVFRILLEAQSLSHLEHHLRRRLKAEDSNLPDIAHPWVRHMHAKVLYEEGFIYLGLSKFLHYLLYLPEENHK
jgi:hypothetical protein